MAKRKKKDSTNPKFYRTQEFRRKQKEKKRKIILIIALVIFILAICCVGALILLFPNTIERFRVLNSSTKDSLEQQGYVPVVDILTLDGYGMIENGQGNGKADGSESNSEMIREDAAGIYFEKDSPYIRISWNEEQTELYKNEYTYTIDSILSITHKLYMKKEFLEKVLGKEIVGDWRDGYSLKEIEQSAHQWTEEEVPLVSHAAGGILDTNVSDNYEQYNYTSCKEALIQSYNLGYRVIEMDFQLSTDGVLCAVHDWENDQAMTSEQWRSYQVEGKYTSMVLEDIFIEMTENIDMYLILDAKTYEWTDEELSIHYKEIYDMAMKIGGEQLLKRIIPQIYEESEYAIIKNIYNWSSIIYTLYNQDNITKEEVMNFVKDKDDISVVTISKDKINQEFCDGLHSINKKIYTHTINNTEDLYVWMNMGADGFYTDTITPDAYLARYGQYEKEE